jgi:hypothetical protein
MAGIYAEEGKSKVKVKLHCTSAKKSQIETMLLLENIGNSGVLRFILVIH